MAAIDFPNSPTTGQTFTVGSKTWTYDGAAWGSSVQRTPVRTISDTAPASPLANDEWFESSTGKSYIYYDSYWVEINSSAQGQPGTYTVSDTAPSSPVSGTTWFNSATGKQYIHNGSVWVEPNSNLAGPTGPQGLQGFTGNKNFILNGGFDIAQRGTVTLTGGGYTLDRWYLSSWGSASSTSVSQQTTGVPSGSRYCMRVTYGASGGYGNMYQFIDTATVSQLWGKTVTLSFKARRSSTWTASTFLSVTVAKTSTVDGGPSATWAALFPSPVITREQLPTGTTSNDWYTFSTTFTVPNDGTANGLFVQFSEQAVGAGNAYYEVAQVQLEVGSTPTDFARCNPTVAAELAACQRFYWNISGANQNIGVGFYQSSSEVDVSIALPVSMRTLPSFSSVTGADYYTIKRQGAEDYFNSFASTSFYLSPSSLLLYNASEVSGTAGIAGAIRTVNANSKLEFSAELA